MRCKEERGGEERDEEAEGNIETFTRGILRKTQVMTGKTQADINKFV